MQQVTVNSFILSKSDAKSCSFSKYKLLPSSKFTSLFAETGKRNFSPDVPPENEPADSQNGYSFTIELGKSCGISWGSDLSFRWIYVRDIDPRGEAALTNLVRKGDYIIGAGNTSLIAQDFDYVLSVRLIKFTNFNHRHNVSISAEHDETTWK